MTRAMPFAAFVLLRGIAFATPPASLPSGFFELLQNHVGVSAHDLTITLPAGLPVAMQFPVSRQGEIAVAGVERLRVPLGFFLDSFRKKPFFRHGQQVLSIHEFSDPPIPADLQSLNLTSGELQALSECKPGKCALKISAPMMERFRAASLPSIGGLYRDAVFQLVTQYLTKGNAAMIAYADKRPPVESRDEFLALVRQFSWVNEAAPPLYRCLESFSGSQCAQIESFLYWTSAKFGLKPVFSVTHAMICRTQTGDQPWVFIAFKQVYADHYLTASLGLVVLAQQSGDPANPKLWVLYMNRSLTDVLGGWLGPLKRSVTRRRSLDAVRKNLLQLKNDLEPRYASAH